MEGRFRSFDTQAETWTGTEDFESQSERRDLNGVEERESRFTGTVTDRRPLIHLEENQTPISPVSREGKEFKDVDSSQALEKFHIIQCFFFLK